MTNHLNLHQYEARYGKAINMLRGAIIGETNQDEDAIIGCIRLWKATRLPIEYICMKLCADEKLVRRAIKKQVDDWKTMGSVPKNDVLGDVFTKHFPELCCIRYTFEDITNMNGKLPVDAKIGEFI